MTLGVNNLAEQKYKQWLDKHNIPYWYIQQDLDTFSSVLKKYMTKRPDFLVLIPNFGFIIVDVKDKEPAVKYEKFFINAEEVEKYVNLQRIFNLQSWYVISSEKYHFRTWFWIPIVNILKGGFIFEPKDNKDKCYSIPISEFIQVSEDDSLERVFSKLLTLK
tara:strand:+ start:886 stop:1371 length:486 start_codon:yes stop_codon:yes gene_type:complete